jgi:anti-sigma regulatory factor (Ser/Thr protein kinase)
VASPDSLRDPEPVTVDNGLDQTFDGTSLVALRAAVSAHGDRLGVTGERLLDLLLVAHELASNAILHGGGRGRLRLWVEKGSVFCLVEDWGQGFAERAAHVGQRSPSVGAANGRGLWLIRQLADDVDVVTGERGTRITARLAFQAQANGIR